MHKYFFLIIALVINLTPLFCQNFTAKIIDNTTKLPIAFAAIQMDSKTGTISNEEGVFSIFVNDPSTTILTISCLGYGNKTITIKEIMNANFIIALDEAINELDEVYLSSKAPNADSIIVKVNAHLDSNYQNTLVQHDVFYRETTYANFKDLDLEVKKASHVKKSQLENANRSLDSLTRVIMNNKMIHFTDFMGKLLVKNMDSAKLKVDKATKLIDKSKDFSIESIQDKAQYIVLQYLDKSKTYKLKTGLFKIEDSLALDKDLNDKNEVKNEYELSDLKSGTLGLIKTAQFYDNAFLKNIINPDLYDYTFEKVTYYIDERIYIIGFYPKKSKSKFSGKLYVTDNDYAVIKTDYGYAKGKRGSKFNLKLIFGVKYIENLKKGTVIYKKNDDNIYHPHYIKEEYGNYFYVNRPIKFIENSALKNKVLFNFIIEGGIRQKKEMLSIANKTITAQDYTTEKEQDKIPYDLLKKYDPKIWDSRKVIEPLEEMKQFSSLD